MDYGQWTMDFLLCNVNVKIIEMLITMSLSVNTYFEFLWKNMVHFDKSYLYSQNIIIERSFTRKKWDDTVISKISYSVNFSKVYLIQLIVYWIQLKVFRIQLSKIYGLQKKVYWLQKSFPNTEFSDYRIYCLQSFRITVFQISLRFTLPKSVCRQQ